MSPEQSVTFNFFDDSLLLKALQTATDATAIYINEDIQIRFANDAMLKIWGKDSGIIGKTLAEALPELDGQPFIEILQRVWRTGITYSVFDTPATLEINGELKTAFFDFEYRALQDENKQTWCIIHSTKDVTQRREQLLRLEARDEAEQTLNEEMAATVEELLSTNEELNRSMGLLADSREHIRTIINQAPVGICMLEGPEHIIEIANPAILKIWGRTPAEVIGKSHLTARPELKGQPVNDWLKTVFETGIPKVNHEFQVNLYNKGSLRKAIVNSIYQPISSSRGEITGVLVILEDITSQVLSRQAHERDQHMLGVAIEAGELGTFYYEPSNNLFSGNNLLKSWFGLPAHEHMDLSKAIDAVVESDRKRVGNAILEALAPESGGNYAIEYQICAGPGEPLRTVQALGKVIYENGLAISLNGTLRDVTEQKKDEQRKDDFISMVSHELKTPLTSINAYIQVLQRKAIQSGDKLLQDTLEKTLKQVRNMGSMINGFLNVSRLDSGKMAIDLLEFEMVDLFTELEDELQSTVHTHRLEFKYGAPVKIKADREKIAQVIQNLVGNAVKYAPMGTNITVGFEKKGNHQLTISVKDEGMGIDKADQSQIFERYYRVKNNNMGSISGFGIGLYLCREIISRHGGEISIESTPGKGALFLIKLPID
ncbi:ATP-binding protein [Pedobacter aquatilis]|uniref:ATP-binding protein n=1 Tax=Pedobacter aquatilis TaxID=351343 RepID=UPI00292E779F|nr:ATP-binding protein [Pedobacter aquatilis]